jgi:hypothetical protein
MRTGCLIKMLPQNHFLKLVKVLTSAILVAFACANIALAENRLSQEKASTYLRWNLFTGRDQLQFSKNGVTVTIKTLNEDLFKSIKEEASNLKIEDSYIKKISFKENDQNNSAQSIEVELQNDSVEMLQRAREKVCRRLLD